MDADALRALATVVLVDRPLEEVMAEIAGIANRAVPEAEATSITLVRGDRAWTAASTGSAALDADLLQYAEGHGPCMDAGRTGMPLVVTDMRSEDRWPDYAARVVQKGVLSSLSSPLPFQGRTIGALNHYASRPGAFDSAALEVAEVAASLIGVAIMNADAHDEAATTARQMREALESRKVIDMAIGILIARHHCSPDEAFGVLSRASQNGNRRLRDLAAALVEAEAAAPEKD